MVSKPMVPVPKVIRKGMSANTSDCPNGLAGGVRQVVAWRDFPNGADDVEVNGSGRRPTLVRIPAQCVARPIAVTYLLEGM